MIGAVAFLDGPSVFKSLPEAQNRGHTPRATIFGPRG
jgi:hypothetical protein